MNYIKDFLQAIYNFLFQSCYGLTPEEIATVERLIKESNDIAAGKYVAQSSLPYPTIPERRKSVRE